MLTDRAKHHLAWVGYDVVCGTRPLKRLIQREILNPLALQLLKGSLEEGQTVHIDEADGRLIFS